MKFLLFGFLFVACDVGEFNATDEEDNLSYPPAANFYVTFPHKCTEYYKLAEIIPSEGWYNQLAILNLGTLPVEDPYSEDVAWKLNILHFKHGLLKMVSEHNVDEVEATFYSWPSPGFKSRLISAFERCR